MAKIADVVQLKTGYANFVELKSAFMAMQENADRMAMYRPTKSHRQAFDRLCRGLYQPNDKKFYLLSGSYGTGKSHLCLMFANLLSRASSDPDLKGFYDNYEKLESEMARMLRNIRKDGQYLVAICDYHSGKRFEDVVLKAVLEACQSRGLETVVQTEFDEAERLLADWENKAQADKDQPIRNFYADFGQALDRVAPGMTVEQVRAGLKNYDSDALDIFRSAFRETMGGLEFQAHSGNLIPILRNLVRSPAFKERFKGLAIFFDEFGFTLEKAAYSKDVLQGFMETICKNEPNILFVGCIHKDFKAYADRFSTDDAAVMSARLTPVDLFNEGIEEIIGAIVESEKTAPVWVQEVQPKTGIFDQMLPTCKTLALFPWIEEVKQIRQRVLEDIYGVHPVALACLLRLSAEIGSDARSTFTFFSGEVGGAPGSYAEFIAAADLTVDGGKLNLYTVDRLFTFFQRELAPTNPELRDQQRPLVNGYYASLEALRKAFQGELFEEINESRVAVLRSILIYQLCRLPTSLENLQFGLYCLSRTEQKQVEGHLKYLEKIGAVFFRKQSQTYELAVSGLEDPYELIDRYLGDVTLHPEDLVAAFLEEAADGQKLEFLEAKQYNLPYGEDKRCRTYFVRPRAVGDTFWQTLKADWENSRNNEKKSYEGVVVYILCEDEGEIKLAQSQVQQIPAPYIAVSVPHSPQPFTDLLLQVKACRHYLPPQEAEKISAQTEARLRDLLESLEDGYLPQLQRLLNTILSGEAACWYGQNGKVWVDRPQQSHRPADLLCEELFTQRCRIKHPDINLVHDGKWRQGTNTALKQAVKVLLEAERVMIDNGNPDNHGEKRYLEKVLLKGAGALKRTGAAGKVTFFDCDDNPENISANFPVLKELCRRLMELNPGTTLSLGSFLMEAKSAPYGAGGTALILALAHTVRAFGERLRSYPDSTKIVEFPLDSYEKLVEVVGSPATKVVIAVQEMSPAQAALVDGLAKAVQASPMKYGEKRTLTSTDEALGAWWKKIPRVVKIVELYEPDRQKRLRQLQELLDRVEDFDRFDLILKELPGIYLAEPVGADLSEAEATTVNTEFAADVKLLESGWHLVCTSLAEAVGQVFGSQGDLVQCEQVVSKWYAGLNPTQRDPYKFEEEVQSFLRRLSDKEGDFADKLLTSLPQDYGLEPVADWSTLKIQDLVDKLTAAKAAIEGAQPEVPIVNIKEDSYSIRPDEKLEVAIPPGVAELIYTTSGEDPKKTKHFLVARENLNLAELLDEHPNVTVYIRSRDAAGNLSHPVRVELVNKSKEYEIEIEKDLFKDKGVFKFPEDAQGLVTVIASLLQQGVKKKFIEPGQMNKVMAAVQQIIQ
ncbi:MAG: hypothetical protein PHW74_03385 [Desulfobacca sp.]|nr:hypothetical protein [Desulfobacca sp.]